MANSPDNIKMYNDFTDKRGRVWEWFVDECYYQMVCVRPKGVKDFNNEMSFHFNTDDLARQFVNLVAISS